MVYNSVLRELKDKNTSAFEQNGIQYIDAEELLDILGIACVRLDDKLSFIKDGVFYEIGVGNIIKRDFKDYALTNDIAVKEYRIYLPIREISELLGYESDYNADRNMMNISEKTAPDQSSN